MGKPLITGIDIGHYSIKAVVLKPASDDYSLVSFKELPISGDVFSDNHTVNHQQIVNKLKELRKFLPIWSKRVAIAIPDNAVISKVLQIDSDLDERETEFAIYQGFSHQSPFPIEELSLDFVRVDNDSKTQTVAYQVYATKKDVVDSRYQSIKKAGFLPIVCDVQAHGLVSVWRQAAKMTANTDWLLVDVGYTQTSLCMDFDNKAHFSKEMAIGTQYLEQSSSPMNALLEKRIDQFIQLMIDRIQRQIQMLLSVNGNSAVKGIWLSGGGATTPMLVEEIQRRLCIECQVLNPLSLLGRSRTRKPHHYSDLHGFNTAVGIAMRGHDWLEVQHAL
ncbi:type IV pilus assembly protein PilM [Vibrio sp. YMD68]|uniref:type IV pilus assembly protein PilM n=1 Tax=Vibrio sp. YMD68 TaxID=3042300 RepID=UPI00249A3E6F|nr:type IV pilus assembly protein PilM [Vibrio sp. YMD68]WGW00575.1 type IV pilus assembly protein PilM [Vibrio sp. YMD68]